MSRKNSVSPVAKAWWYAGRLTIVVGEISPALASVLDVVDGQVQLLEGEAADLAHHARDHLVGGLREGMSF